MESKPIGPNSEPVVKTEDKKDKSKGGASLIAKTMVGLLLLLVILTAGALVYSQFSGELSNDSSNPENDDENSQELVVQVTPQEKQIIDLVEENMHSVVSIAVSELSFSPDQGVVDRSSNIGSGFIVDPSGMIVTNQHVVSNLNSSYKVITEDGTEYEVKEIVRDDINDVAIIKIEAQGLNPVELGDSDALLQGQTVVAIGTPLGEYAGSVTTGVISGLDRSVTTGSGSFFSTTKTFENVIQTDAAINPGNSGGPLLNSSGEVIGINFATTAGAANISFALPINFVKERLDEYRTFGKFIKPYIGIEYQMISEAEASYYQGLVAGAFVRNVVQDGPADQGGVERADIITKMNGEAVTGSFAAMIQQFDVGEEITLEVFREGEYLELKVVLQEAEI